MPADRDLTPETVLRAIIASPRATGFDRVDGLAREYDAPNGRKFFVLEQDDGRFLVDELLPSGLWTKDAAGRPKGVVRDSRVPDFLADPNAFTRVLRERGLDLDRVAWRGNAARGPRLFHLTLEAAAAAIHAALVENRWYEGVVRPKPTVH